MIVVLRNLYAQVQSVKDWVKKTTCGGHILNNSLWKSSAVIELYFTLVEAVWRRNGLRSRPTVFKSVQCQSCYSCCHSGESGRDRQVGAQSTVTRRADKTSSQRIAVKSFKEEFFLS